MNSLPSSLPTLLPWLSDQRPDLDAVLLDVDGVLLLSGHLLPGAVDLISWLRHEALPFVMLTNDGCNSPAEKAAELRQAGLDVQAVDIVSSGHALEECVVENGLVGELFFLMGRLGDPCYAELAGLRVTRDSAMIDACQGVLIGEKHYDWERAITTVWNYLIGHSEAPVIVPNPDVFFPTRGGGVHPASGAVAMFLEALCCHRGKELRPMFLGKPHRPIFAHAQRVLERRYGRRLCPERMLMVGDSLAGDVRGGVSYGCRTALLMTGVTTAADLSGGGAQPDGIFWGLSA